MVSGALWGPWQPTIGHWGWFRAEGVSVFRHFWEGMACAVAVPCFPRPATRAGRPQADGNGFEPKSARGHNEPKVRALAWNRASSPEVAISATNAQINWPSGAACVPAPALADWKLRECPDESRRYAGQCRAHANDGSGGDAEQPALHRGLPVGDQGSYAGNFGENLPFQAGDFRAGAFDLRAHCG